MIIEIFDLPPMPRNRSHMLTVAGKRPMNIKTPLCREFEKDLERRLDKYHADFVDFLNHPDRVKGYISAKYIIYTPVDSLFTKSGEISARSVDLDAHKAFQDTIFRCIGIDDKLVREVTYVSPPSNDGTWNYRIELNWRKIECLNAMSFLTQNSATPTNEISESFALL